mgnify:CR=1 FL=1
MIFFFRTFRECSFSWNFKNQSLFWHEQFSQLLIDSTLTPPPPSKLLCLCLFQPYPWVYPGFYPWPYPCIWTFTSHFNLEPLPFPWNHIYCIYPSYPLNSGVYIIPKMFTPGWIHVGAFGMWPVREEYTSGWVLLASLANSGLRPSAFGLSQVSLDF